MGAAALVEDAVAPLSNEFQGGVKRGPHAQVVGPAAGGIGPGATFLASAEVYYTPYYYWTAAGSMPTARASHTATKLTSRVRINPCLRS